MDLKTLAYYQHARELFMCFPSSNQYYPYKIINCSELFLGLGYFNTDISYQFIDRDYEHITIEIG